MSGKTYDVAVAYRVYPGVSRTPALFADDKLKLVELCLRSFKKALGSLRAKLWVLLDDCPPAYEALFRSLFPADHTDFLPLNGVGNFATFDLQKDLLAKQQDAELVYFAEDDYFYLANALEIMAAFLRTHPDADFVTAYDHPDYYSLALHREPCWLRIYGDRHWRTASSTCMTFLTTRDTLRRSERIFRTYKFRNIDASFWMALTKQGVGPFNPWQAARCGFAEPQLIRVFLKTWVFGWRQILFGKKWRLWVPVPGLGTHIERKFLAPGTDWLEVMSEEAAGMLQPGVVARSLMTLATPSAEHQAPGNHARRRRVCANPDEVRRSS